jgi:hypothetical protein
VNVLKLAILFPGIDLLEMFNRAAVEHELNPPPKPKPTKSPAFQSTLDFGTAKRKAPTVVEQPIKRVAVDKTPSGPSKLMMATMSRQSSFDDTRANGPDNGFDNDPGATQPLPGSRGLIVIESDDDYFQDDDGFDWDAELKTVEMLQAKMTSVSHF